MPRTKHNTHNWKPSTQVIRAVYQRWKVYKIPISVLARDLGMSRDKLREALHSFESSYKTTLTSRTSLSTRQTSAFARSLPGIVDHDYTSAYSSVFGKAGTLPHRGHAHEQ